MNRSMQVGWVLCLWSLLPASLSSQTDNNRSRQSRPAAPSGSLQVGQLAPTFALADPESKETFRLRDFRGKKPVVLLFGSYT